MPNRGQILARIEADLEDARALDDALARRDDYLEPCPLPVEPERLGDGEVGNGVLLYRNGARRAAKTPEKMWTRRPRSAQSK
jgi:hypothetical protein